MTRLNTTPTTLLCAEDPLIDMAFITTYTGMTDKWFYQLMSQGRFPKPIKLGRSSRWYKVTWNPGCASALRIPVAPEQRRQWNGKTTPYSAMDNPSTLDVSSLPATVLWYRTLSRVFSFHRRPCATVTFLYPGTGHCRDRPANR